MVSINTEKITHAFKSTKVLNEIDLTISDGEVFGLLGPTGAGKTTLINILTGQLQQTEGVAKLLGKDTRKLEQKDYEAVGMVLDHPGQYERLSCYNNLKIFVKIYGLSKDKIEEVLRKVGLWEVRKTLAVNLSKGMKQRLSLARAILHEPKVLFLDEPTSGLDPSTVREIHRLILEEKEKGATIFLTTHNMDEATKLCDHVALLHEGRIVEYGHPLEVCERYNHQNKIQLILNNGESISLSNDVTSADEISDYFRKNLVKTIHSSEPNLETVFVELTGRRFE